MDCVCKEHPRNEESSLDVNNQFSMCDSLTNLEDNNSNVVNEAKNKEDFVDEGGHAEDFSTTLSPLASDLDEMTATAVDPKQRSSEERVHGLVYDSSDILAQQIDHLSEVTGMKFDDSISVLENMAAADCADTSNKDKEINMLKEEVCAFDTFNR